ncbi:MAG: PEP-CTERM sorting domain-containing protein [Cyanobacteria bacterium P01_D01_bin.73]
MNTLLKSAAVISAVVIGVGTAGAASAATIVSKSIDFRDFGGGTEYFEELFKDLGDGVSVTVTAGRHSGGPRADAPFDRTRDALVTESRNGLGVYSSLFDSNQLDGRGRADFLRFTFSQEVTLHKAFLSSAQRNDEFDAAIDDVDLDINDTFGTDRIVRFPELGNSGIHVVNFKNGVDFDGDGTNRKFSATGTIFDFYTTERNDDYRVAGLKIWTEVPEPGMVFGLLGIGAVLAGSSRKREDA